MWKFQAFLLKKDLKLTCIFPQTENVFLNRPLTLNWSNGSCEAEDIFSFCLYSSVLVQVLINSVQLLKIHTFWVYHFDRHLLLNSGWGGEYTLCVVATVSFFLFVAFIYSKYFILSTSTYHINICSGLTRWQDETHKVDVLHKMALNKILQLYFVNYTKR